jgi:hypothetical chaperone protein
MTTFYGLDFGTANTSLAISQNSSTDVLRLFNNNSSIPSTYFFDFEDDSECIGEAAFDKFYFGDRGRFLRSFKSALGTSTIDHEIQIKLNRYSIKQITQNFIGQILRTSETLLDEGIESLVVGRPVQFVDDDPIADAKAQQQLLEVVQGLGVKNVEFQFEPIAAALNYGISVEREELVLVVDIGAGTSDFSVVKFAPRKSMTAQAEVISNCGVHIGGNDFDKAIALKKVMPLFGYQQRFKRREQLELPHHYFVNAATWHKIDHLYDRKVINALKEIQPQISEPILIQRFLDLITGRQLHTVLVEAEAVKKQLSENATAKIDLDFLERDLIVDLPKEDFDNLVEPLCDSIIQSAIQALTIAGLDKTDIDSVYVTGGSMGIQQLFDRVVAEFPDAKLVDGDRATSVARGLAIHAEQIFS